MGLHRGSHLGLWNNWDPTWDPTWDYGTTGIPHGIPHGITHGIPHGITHGIPPIEVPPGKAHPGRIKPRIPPIPLGILPQISDSFPPGKSYLV